METNTTLAAGTPVAVKVWGMVIDGTVVLATPAYVVVRLDDTRTRLTVSYSSIEAY